MTDQDQIQQLTAQIAQKDQQISDLESEIKDGWMESNTAGGKIIQDLAAQLAAARDALAKIGDCARGIMPLGITQDGIIKLDDARWTRLWAILGATEAALATSCPVPQPEKGLPVPEMPEPGCTCDIDTVCKVHGGPKSPPAAASEALAIRREVILEIARERTATGFASKLEQICIERVDEADATVAALRQKNQNQAEVLARLCDALGATDRSSTGLYKAVAALLRERDNAVQRARDTLDATETWKDAQRQMCVALRRELEEAQDTLKRWISYRDNAVADRDQWKERAVENERGYNMLEEKLAQRWHDYATDPPKEEDGTRISGYIHSKVWRRCYDGSMELLDWYIIPSSGKWARIVWPQVPAEPDYRCMDCGMSINDGEFKTFGVCDKCWEKTHAKYAPVPSEPCPDKDEEAFDEWWQDPNANPELNGEGNIALARAAWQAALRHARATEAQP